MVKEKNSAKIDEIEEKKRREELERLETLEVGRARSGIAAKIVFILAAILAFVEIGFVLDYNLFLWDLFRKVGINLSFLLYKPDNVQNMAVVLGIIYALAFILYPISKRVKGEKVPLYDWILAAIAASGPLYMYYYFPIFVRIGYPEMTFYNLLFAGLTIIFLLEATRRALGPVLPIIVVVVLGYMLWDANFNLRPVINHLYFEAEGIFSIPLFVMVIYVFAFLFFGAFLEKIGVGEYISDLMIAAFGRRAGGPAKSAVVSSALMGMISGSSVGNVLTTGTFTIPLMKKTGFPPEVAGGVEPAASTGGQLMPPIMGAAAFLMAEFLGRPYREIIIAAAIPAFLYFLSIYVFVDRETKILGLAGLSESMIPSLKKLLKKVYLLAPIAVITYVLLIGVDPQFAVMASISSAFLVAVYANENISKKDKIILTILLAVFSSIFLVSGAARGTIEKRVAQSLYFGSILTLVLIALIGLKVHGIKWMKDAIVGAVDRTARSSVGVFLAAASAGMIQGFLTYTGLATQIGYRLVDMVAGNFLLLLVLTMAISLVLGMGIPTTANYIITSSIAAPAILHAAETFGLFPGLTAAGILLTAHMFVFYFGILADVTPPVALAAYAGATLAGGKFWKTALNASKFALAGYLIPYICVMKPELLVMTIESWDMGHLLNLVVGFGSAVLTILLLSSGITGWLNGRVPKWSRPIFVVLGALTIMTNEIMLVISLVFYLAMYLFQAKRYGKEGKTARLITKVAGGKL